MKKVIVLAGVVIALTAMLESCGGPRIHRPYRAPRVPRKMAMVMPQPPANTAVAVLG